ncbi:MAG: YheT family hydrolase [Burkholderiales bacterium]|jgi:predicted alpha/beta-fold hydrolase
MPDSILPSLEALLSRAPWWLRGPPYWSDHVQTIWAPLWARRCQTTLLPWRRERCTTPDGDFIDIDWLDDVNSAGLPNSPLLVLFHGLEGSSASHYAQAFADVCRRRRWCLAIPHFRGCSGELNLAPRAYHSGDFEEIGWMLARCKASHGPGPIWAAGVSLGGNALLRWAQEAGSMAAKEVKAIAAVSAPLDLGVSGRALCGGFNRHVYGRMFLRTMKPKALRKLQQHPGLFDRSALMASRDLYEFDHVFTAPLHGFKNTDDYWQKASSRPGLKSMALPTLLINALNDPFVPLEALPSRHAVSPYVTLVQPSQGGHVGFVRGAWPGEVTSLPEAVLDWMVNHA